MNVLCMSALTMIKLLQTSAKLKCYFCILQYVYDVIVNKSHVRVNKHEIGFHLRLLKLLRFVTLLLGAFLFCLHSAVLQVSKSPHMIIGA